MSRTTGIPVTRPRYAHWAHYRALRSVGCMAVGMAVVLIADSASAQTGSFVQWDFNTKSLNASFTAPGYPGTVTPTVSLVGGVSSSFIFDNSGQSGENPSPNYYLRTTGYPASGGNGQNGVSFNSVDTTGRRDILVSFSFGLSDSASRWYQPQYSLDGTTFNDFGGPLEFKKNQDPGTPNWANPTTVSLAGVSAANGASNLSVRLVSIFQPGTTSYQAVSGAYSTAGTVNFDLVTFGVSNRLNAGVSSPVTLTTGSNWSLGAPVDGGISSNLVFGQNTNSGVSAVSVNVPSIFRAQSITFASDANKPYIFSTTDGTGTVVLQFGATDVSSIMHYTVGTSLVNASGLAHTFALPVELSASQTWDAGVGLSFTQGVRFNVQSTAVGVPTITMSGANITVSQFSELVNFTGSSQIVMNGGGALVLNGATGSSTPSALINFSVNGGALRVLNSSGTATAGGSVTVNSSGRLEGTGRIAPMTGNGVTVNPNGTIRGGFAKADGATDAQAVGMISINSNLLVRGGTIAADFNGGTGSPSKVVVTGSGVTNFDVAGGGAFRIQLLNTQALTPNTPYSFIIASSEGGFQRNGVGTTLMPPTFLSSDFVLSGSFPGFTSVSLVVVGSGKDLQLNFTPVPEPAHALGLGVAALAVWYRRRTRPATPPAGN